MRIKLWSCRFYVCSEILHGASFGIFLWGTKGKYRWSDEAVGTHSKIRELICLNN